MLTIGYFFVMLVQLQAPVTLGAYADWASCQAQRYYVEAEGVTTSECFAAPVEHICPVVVDATHCASAEEERRAYDERVDGTK